MQYRRLAFRFAAAICTVVALTAAPAAELRPDDYIGYVRYLASPELKGRGDGSPELEKAARYIEHQFRSFGLKPPPGQRSYQPFKITTKARLGRHNRFEFTAGGTKGSLRLIDDYLPFNFSSSGDFSAPVVFAGYGITAPEYHYDDYAGIDVRGKFVIVLRHEPQEFDDKSVFAGKVFTGHAQLTAKASNAKMHGARGVIFVNDVYAHTGREDNLDRFGRAAGPADAGVAFVQVKASVVEPWLEQSGHTLQALEESIDSKLQPASFELPSTLLVHLRVEIGHVVKSVRNVVAYLPGDSKEYVIIGAHYDHLGLGNEYSLAPDQIGTIHPGADDNASGTAGVLELARYFASRPRPARGILFLTFAGEELGLLGSIHYASSPELPLSNAVAMINLDMIGRIRDSKVYVGGAGSGTTFKPMLEDLRPRFGLSFDYSDQMAFGASDHTSFATRQVPYLFFFSGLHADYHRPGDTWDKIDGPGAVRLLGLIAGLTARLASEPGRPQFVKIAPPAAPLGAASGSSGYGAYFGGIPDFSQTEHGVRFAGIRAGSPAGKAGIRPGDILTRFDGKPIQNLYDFTYALRAHKPGDRVRVTVMRGGIAVESEVLLEQRR